MPQRSLSGSVLRWPSSESLLEATAQPELEGVGVFGSYGRGDAGVGSDLDLLLVVRQCELPIWERLRHDEVTPFEAYMKAIDKARFKSFLPEEHAALAHSSGGTEDAK